MPRDQSKERKLLESVFASLRPPDPVARPRTAQEDPATVGRSRARALAPPALDITTLLSTPDFADCIAEHVVSRSTVCALARTSRALRAAVDASASLSCLGLFRTPYGRQHGTMLFPHQRRSLAHLRAAESPAGWKFGDVRGGILADDPGLGKTVTALALVVSTAGTPPATPQEFWDATGTGWEELCSNVAARRQLIPMLNALTSELETIVAHHRPLAHLDFVERMTPLYTFAQAVDTAGAFPTLDSFGGALHSIARDAAARLTAPGLTTAQATARLLEPVRVGLNRMRGALDKRRRAWFSSAVGRRAVFERCLVPAASTLVVVPAALLEHWYEQIRRHIDLRAIARAADPSPAAAPSIPGGGGPSILGDPFAAADDESASGADGSSLAPGAVWIDGLGDMASVGHAFRLPAVVRGSLQEDLYTLSSYSIVLTTYERCAREAERGGLAGEECSSHPSPLMRLRWLRLLVDEGHEIGGDETVQARAAAHAFITGLAAERRWVMSGTPVAGARNMDVLSVGDALWQLQRLLAFLRAPPYGVDGQVSNAEADELHRAMERGAPGRLAHNGTASLCVAERRWAKDVQRPMLAGRQAGADALLRALRPLMVRHTKADLALPPPVFLPDWEARLCRTPAEVETRFTARVCEAVAGHVAGVMADARAEWNRAQRDWDQLSLDKRATPPPRPRAVVFSEYLNDLEQVTSSLESLLGAEAVAQHWGTYQSTELARFRSQHCAYRACPRCGMHNDVGGAKVSDVCDRRLIEVALEPHHPHAAGAASMAFTPGLNLVGGSGAPPPPAAAGDPDDAERKLRCNCCKTGAGCDARAWPVEPERVWVADPLAPSGWRLWAVGDYTHFNHFGQVPAWRKLVWIDPDPHTAAPDSTLPPPVWPSASTPPLGGPNGRMLPGRLRGWARCGTYVAVTDKPRSFRRSQGLPPAWIDRGVPVGPSASLRAARWQRKRQDCYVLMLDEHGAHGLDLYFVTHIFVVNPVLDPALFRQVVARAHRMGATAPVSVQTMRLWED